MYVGDLQYFFLFLLIFFSQNCYYTTWRFSFIVNLWMFDKEMVIQLNFVVAQRLCTVHCANTNCFIIIILTLEAFHKISDKYNKAF